MMLIDAVELKRQIENALKKQKAKDYDLVKVSELPVLIDSQPTAYDVDKVVDRLEEKRKSCRNDAKVQMNKCNEDWGQFLDGMQCGIRDSIKIIKEGGVNG